MQTQAEYKSSETQGAETENIPQGDTGGIGGERRQGGITGEHGGRRKELTTTRGRTKGIYSETLTRGSGTGGARRGKHKGGSEEQDVTHEG